MKRKLSQILVLLLSICLLTACGFSFKNGGDGEVFGVDAESHVPDTSSQNTGDLRVGVLYNAYPGRYSSYTTAHQTGIEAAAEALGLSEENFYEEVCMHYKDEDEVEKAIQLLLDHGCNLIISTSVVFQHVIENMAEENPDVIFAVCSGNVNNGRNLLSYFGSINDARYISGVVAGMATKDNKIGYVAAQGKENAEVTGGIDAFALGVQSTNPRAKIKVSIVGDWFDEDKERAAALLLVDEGCDVITQHSDSQIVQRVISNAGMIGIGYNQDMSSVFPNTAITSVVWNWSVYYQKLFVQLLDGTFSCQDYLGSLEDGMCSISDAAKWAEPVIQNAIASEKEELISGSKTVFTGPITDNEGNQIIGENQTLTEEEIQNDIHWYLDNIEVIGTVTDELQ